MKNRCVHSLPLSWELTYYILLAAIFMMGLWMRAQLPTVPFLESDSVAYLQPSLTYFTQGSLQLSFREFLYPWLLWCMLWADPNFTIIVVVQHGVGILAAIILIIAWHRMRIFLPSGRWVDILHRLGGCVLAVAYFLPNVTIFLEHAIRPEIFFQLTIALCLLVATEFARSAFRFCRFGVREGILGTLLIFLSFAAYDLRPYFGVGVVCVLLPLMVAFFVIPGKWTVKGSSLAVGALLVYSLLITPERRFHPATQSSGNEYYMAEMLFTSSCDVIYDLLSEDIRALPVGDSRRAVLESLVRSMNKVAYSPNDPDKTYGFTHFDPDRIKYHGPFRDLCLHLQWDEKRIKNFLYHYYFRAWETHPFLMIKKGIVQIWYFYSPFRGRVFEMGGKISSSKGMQKNIYLIKIQGNFSDSWPPFQDFVHRVAALQNSALPTVRIPLFMRILGFVMNAFYLLSLVLVVFVVISLHFGRLGTEPELSAFKSGSIWACYLFGYNFGMSLTIAFVHEMAQSRYHFGQTLFSATSECYALVLLIALAITRRQASREKKNLAP